MSKMKTKLQELIIKEEYFKFPDKEEDEYVNISSPEIEHIKNDYAKFPEFSLDTKGGTSDEDCYAVLSYSSGTIKKKLKSVNSYETIKTNEQFINPFCSKSLQPPPDIKSENDEREESGGKKLGEELCKSINPFID